ncbi:MAG: LPS export ABC transporter permease LptF [Candidatus Thiodiazotropha sp.]
MISLIDRYLLKEVLKALFAILAVLALILASNIFIRLLKEVAAGDLGTNLLFQMAALQLIRFFSDLVPPAFFFSVLYAVGRMYRDSEMVALEACGVGRLRLYRSLTLTLLPVLLFVGWQALYVNPWAARAADELVAAQEGQASELAGISAGRFNEYSKGDTVVYVESIDKQAHRMRNVFVQQRRSDTLNLITAKSGFQRIDAPSGDRYLVLDDGYRYEGRPGDYNYRVSEFGRYALRIQDNEGSIVAQRRKSMKNSALLASGQIADYVELQTRLVKLLAVLVFALLSLPLSRTLPRQGPFGRLVLAFVIYTVYFSMQGVAQRWMLDGVTPLWLGLWWVHLVLAGVGLLLLVPESGVYRSWRRRWRLRRA